MKRLALQLAAPKIRQQLHSDQILSVNQFKENSQSVRVVLGVHPLSIRVHLLQLGKEAKWRRGLKA